MNPFTTRINAAFFAPLLLGAAAVGEPVVVCDAAPRAIPDGAGAVTIPLDVQAPGAVTDVRLELELTHPWVGDLVVTLTSPTGTSVRLLDRPGTTPAGFPGPWGCGGDDIDAVFTDDATTDATDACSISGVPVYAGELLPADALDAFDGENAAGVWTLEIADAQGGDAGAFVRACLDLDHDNACTGDFDGDGDVDLSDFGVFGAAFGSVAGDANYNPAADLDGDGDVDLSDFGVFGVQFGRTDC